jgi:hypothetical protein
MTDDEFFETEKPFFVCTYFVIAATYLFPIFIFFYLKNILSMKEFLGSEIIRNIRVGVGFVFFLGGLASSIYRHILYVKENEYGENKIKIVFLFILSVFVGMFFGLIHCAALFLFALWFYLSCLLGYTLIGNIVYIFISCFLLFLLLDDVRKFYAYTKETEEFDKLGTTVHYHTNNYGDHEHAEYTTGPYSFLGLYIKMSGKVRKSTDDYSKTMHGRWDWGDPISVGRHHSERITNYKGKYYITHYFDHIVD